MLGIFSPPALVILCDSSELCKLHLPSVRYNARCCTVSFGLWLQDISLAEALTGTSFYVQHLDGRVLDVLTLPGEVIKPDSWKCINEEGMPVHGRPYEKGNLYIRFSVTFPESLSSEEVQQLKQVLPSPPQPQAPMSEDEPEQVTICWNPSV